MHRRDGNHFNSYSSKKLIWLHLSSKITEIYNSTECPVGEMERLRTALVWTKLGPLQIHTLKPPVSAFGDGAFREVIKVT